MTSKIKIILSSFLFMCGMMTNSCSDSSASTTTQTEETSDFDKENIPQNQSKDTVESESPNKVNERIQDLESKQTEVTQDIDSTKKKLSDNNDKYSLLIMISLVISLLGIVFAIIAVFKAVKVSNRADRHRGDIDDIFLKLNKLELKETSNAPSSRASSYSGINAYDYRDLSERISRIEYHLRQRIPTTNQTPVVNKPVVNYNRDNDTIHRGYFGLPIQMSLTEAYFKRLSDTRESDSRFTVEIRNAKAEFRPLEGTQYLNDLKSNDSIKMALYIQGCAPSEATQMKVILPGEAKKEGDRWIITKKATIALYR